MARIALCLIVKGDDKEAKCLERCLKHIKGQIDGIFITITHKKGERINKKTVEVASTYGARISHFEWVNDFAKARNFNFSQVPKEYDYILWLDADDVIRGGEKIKETVDKNKDVDVFSFFYLYWFDEFKNPTVVHHKSRIVRNDGCVEWAGALHEDFKENRKVSIKHVDGIEVLHLTDEARVAVNKERNLEVALSQLEREPNDPRAYWNVGNSYKAMGMDKEALEVFDTFLKMSKSNDEKYIARLRRAESYWLLGDKQVAMDEARYAIGLKPSYPDAYHLLGSLQYEMGLYEDAVENYKIGLTRKPPYYQIIVYNPRDYDYVPMMNLAKCYFKLSLPQLSLPLLEACAKIQPKDKQVKKMIKLMKIEAEKADKVVKLVSNLRNIKDKVKLKRELDRVPTEFKSHPGICNLRNINFIKETSKGNELVIFCGFTEEQWSPETARTKGIGGSEEAVIHLSKRLVERGWDVTVYSNCGHKEMVFDRVKYKPFWSFNSRDKVDRLILWRSPKMCDYELNADKVFIDLHDVIQSGEFTEERMKKIDKVFVKSEFHRSLFLNIPDEKIIVAPNGIESAVFASGPEKDPYLLVNTSSPDRSLSALVEWFPYIKRKVPQARCVWAYGWGVFDIVHGDDLEMMKWKDELKRKMKEAGIVEMGRISHSDVATLYMEGSVFAYPSEFAEIDCISLTKALASGCVPVTTDFSAMGEKQFYGTFIHSKKTKDTWCLPYQYDFALSDKKAGKKWAKAVVKMLKKRPKNIEEMRKVVQAKYDWEAITNVWDSVLK